jgi:hypothetical protein
VNLGSYYIPARTAVMLGVLALVIVGAVLKFTVFNGSSTSATPPVTTLPTGTTPTGTTPGSTTTSGTVPTTPGTTTPVRPGVPPNVIQPQGTNGVITGQVISLKCTGQGKKRKCKPSGVARGVTIVFKGSRPPTRGKTFRTKTDKTGRYSLQVAPGLYVAQAKGKTAGPTIQVNIFPHQVFYAQPLILLK